MKLNTLFKLGFIFVMACQFSCRKDFNTLKSSGNLNFSKDTIFLDTVFNNLSTTTKLLKVYNNTNDDMLIPNIKLGRSNSKYRINVDGVQGTEFNDVLILKKDSIYVFVETTFDDNQERNEMVYKDSILFDADGLQQHVNLITLVKDATFLFDSQHTDFELSETVLSNTKPYVIYGNAIVPTNGSLTIEAGAIIHFSKNSSLSVSKGADLIINGTLKDSVVFKSDNLNYDYNQIPGQWYGVNINNASNVDINYLKILNPTIAFKITNNTNPINLKNIEIHNASENGIYTTNANIIGENLVIGQTGKSSLYLQGGNYTFKHATFANYWSKGIRTQNTVYLSNYYLNEDNTETPLPLYSANFINSIISGSKNSELLLDNSNVETIFNFNIQNCLINLQTGDDLYNTSNTAYYDNILLNKTLDFRNTNNNDLRIGLDNEGINKADVNAAKDVPLDITGIDRTIAPDIGAYQHIDFKTLEPEEDNE